MTFGESNPSYWYRQPGEKIVSTWQACPAAPAGQSVIAAPTCVTASDGQVYARYVDTYSTVGLPASHTVNDHLFIGGDDDSLTHGKTEEECIDACQAREGCQAVQFHADNAETLAGEQTPHLTIDSAKVHPDFEPSRCKLLNSAISWS
jgi:hypothetical protein